MVLSTSPPFPEANYGSISPMMPRINHHRASRPWYDIPSVSKAETSSQVTVVKDNTDNLYLRCADEIQRTLVGPMPVQEFLQFLPKPRRRMPPSKNAFDEVPVTGRKKEIHVPVVDAFNAVRGLASRCPGVKFYNTGDTIEQMYNIDDDNSNFKFDITGYLEETETEEEKVQKKRTMPGHAQIVVELDLYDFAEDPTGDSEGEFILFDHLPEKQKKSARQFLGQQVSYATEIFARQHRNFLFTIFMTHIEARLLRWDRAGVVISSSFNYREQPQLLCEFLWRFGNASDAERGCDTTVRWATVAEEILFKNAIEKHANSQLGDDFPNIRDEYGRHYEPESVRKIPVRNTMIIKEPQELTSEVADGENVIDCFLVSRPVVNAASLASRATRGYWALNVKTKTIVFLKDSWRTNVEGVEIEGDILKSIMNRKVPNVPTLICYGDVGHKSDANPVHITQTDQYEDAIWNAHYTGNSRLSSRIHYRQVIEEAGYTLEHLAGTRELLSGAHSVFRALYGAYESCHRLHRDVSSSNVILYADPGKKYGDRRGILVDWELSCVAKKGDPREHWRTGTWAFMSINTLKPDPKPHQLCHDVESLVYVVFYCALFFLPWDYNEENHRYVLLEFFDQSDLAKKRGGEVVPTTGGKGKVVNLSDYYARGEYFNRLEGMPVWVKTWLDRTFEPMTGWNPNPPELTPEVQYQATYKIFDLSDVSFTTMPHNDRAFHPRPGYKGPPQSFFPATKSSSRPNSRTMESAGKRRSALIPDEPIRKRQKTAEQTPSKASSSTGPNTRNRGRRLNVAGSSFRPKRSARKQSGFETRPRKSR